MRVVVYTDGSSRGNPGPGGYGAILMTEKGHKKHLSEGFRKTTNNRMELLSVIKALEALKRPCDVLIFSDSKYVVDAVEKGWVFGWAKKGFAKKKNPDLWRRYLNVAQRHKVKFEWVKGHNGNEYNEKCDRLAVSAATRENLPPDEGYENEDEQAGFFTAD
ncbi:MAG: ribonuclease HI [Flavobacteriales bacterium]|nr:ribonuclease HI [Flavobacteriales bacterium]